MPNDVSLRDRLLKLVEDYDPAPEGPMLHPLDAIVDFLHGEEVEAALCAQAREANDLREKLAAFDVPPFV